MDNSAAVAADLAHGNPGATIAIMALLSTADGARILKELKISLSPEEWWIIYAACCGKDRMLFTASMLVIDWLDVGAVRKNLTFNKPAPILDEKIVSSTELIKLWSQRKVWREGLDARIRDRFLQNYRRAKLDNRT